MFTLDHCFLAQLLNQMELNLAKMTLGKRRFNTKEFILHEYGLVEGQKREN